MFEKQIRNIFILCCTFFYSDRDLAIVCNSHVQKVSWMKLLDLIECIFIPSIDIYFNALPLYAVVIYNTPDGPYLKLIAVIPL